MTLRGGNEDEWRTRKNNFFLCFRRMHFYFPSVTCWCEKNTTFPFSILCTYSLHGNLQKRFGKVFFSLQHTSRSSADTKLFTAFYPSRPRRPLVKQRKLLAKARRLFTSILVCSESANPHDVDIKRERGYD